MRVASDLCAAIVLMAAIFSIASLSASAEEKPETAHPLLPTSPAISVTPTTPDSSHGAPAWLFRRPEKFDITHTAVSETIFAGRRVDYKDRGAAELTLRVKLEDDASAARTLARPLGAEGFIKNADGTRWDFKFDKDGYTESRGEKKLREFLRDGKPGDRDVLQRAAATPLAELTWDAEGNSRAAITADGLLEPLAEAVMFDRQVELLLPPIPTTLYDGATFHQTARAPSPAPLHGEALVKFTYRVDRLDSNRTAEIRFTGESSEEIPTGFTWGGIPIAEASVKIAIHGRLTRDIRTLALTGAELEYDLQFSSRKVDFSSHLKGRDEWKRKD